MDSMRILNKSLPRSPRKRRGNPSADQLIQSFKTAALTVTKLYKTAVSDQTKARLAGYQDALDDLLLFLDREELGLEDGEGWRVRQWATERLDDSQPSPPPNESDEERNEGEKRSRSDSPKLSRKSDQDNADERPHSAHATPQASSIEHRESESQNLPLESNTQTSVTPGVFSFRSQHPYPQAMDIENRDTQALSGEPLETPNNDPAPASAASMRVEVLPRGPRARHRNNHPKGRHRDPKASKVLGEGAGSKRRVPVAEWFGLGELDEGKEAMGNSSKRGRFA